MRSESRLCLPANSDPQLQVSAEQCGFAELTNKQLRRGAHRSVPALEAAIRAFIDAHNIAGKPFVWTGNADEILASIARFAQRTLDLQAARYTYVTNHWDRPYQPSGHLRSTR